jgi:hypothetical protein
MNILQLTLKKEWFDLIECGEKKEEYREIKPYWNKRLRSKSMDFSDEPFKQFDIVRFRNGYSSTAPLMDVECRGITERRSRPEWCGGKDDYCYVIKLGRVLSTENSKRLNE